MGGEPLLKELKRRHNGAPEGLAKCAAVRVFIPVLGPACEARTVIQPDAETTRIAVEFGRQICHFSQTSRFHHE